MQKIKVSKSALLKKLQENLKQHLEDYNLTFKNYKIKIKENIEKFYQESLIKIEEETDKYIHYSPLTLPISYSKEYETAIEILNFSIDDTIELTIQEFKQYVQDEWTWKQNFNIVSGFYNGNP